MIDMNIKDGTISDVSAEVTAQNALKVSAVDYYTYSTVATFFSNQTYGIDLNKNWSSSIGELISDGGETLGWPGVQTIGTSIDFEDTNNPDTGTNNISVSGSTNGDIAFFEKGSDFTITNELALQGSVYIDTIIDNKSEVKFACWDTVLDVKVGDEKKLYDYVDSSVLGVYQTFNIPIADLGLAPGTVFDALRMKIDKDGQYLDFDDIAFTEAGGEALGTQTFTIEPDRGDQMLVDGFIITMADAYAGTVADGTMPSIRYDGFLGLSELDNGMLFRVINNMNEITFTANLTKLIEMFQFGKSEFSATGSDGTNSWFVLHMKLAAPIVLNDDEKDKIELVLSDNLGGLEWFRWSIDGRQRPIF